MEPTTLSGYDNRHSILLWPDLFPCCFGMTWPMCMLFCYDLTYLHAVLVWPDPSAGCSAMTWPIYMPFAVIWPIMCMPFCYDLTYLHAVLLWGDLSTYCIAMTIMVCMIVFCLQCRSQSSPADWIPWPEPRSEGHRGRPCHNLFNGNYTDPEDAEWYGVLLSPWSGTHLIHCMGSVTSPVGSSTLLWGTSCRKALLGSYDWEIDMESSDWECWDTKVIGRKRHLSSAQLTLLWRASHALSD